MKTVKIGIVLACIAGVFFFLRGGESDEAIPDTPESALSWMCKTCQHTFYLTAKQFADAEAAVSRKQDRSHGPLNCPKCKKEDAWRANKCQIHSKWYFVLDVPGGTGVCPDCAAAPKQVAPDEEVAPPETNKKPRPPVS